MPSSLLIYAHPRILAILFLGLASGMPLALTGATFAIWLAEEGVSTTSIGLFSLLGMPYLFKFLWSPLIDQLSLPLLSRWLGRRRSWLVFSQLLLSGAIIGLGCSNPEQHLLTAAGWALCVAFASATQDIIIDAYRIEILHPSQQGAGAAMAQTGYHIGSKLIAGGLALFLSDHLDWHQVYAIMAGIIWLATLTSLLIGEPTAPSAPAAGSLHERVIAPFLDILRQPSWSLLLLFILFYKFGDAFAGVMFSPFLKAMQFTNTEIAVIIKTYGLFAMIAGTFLGGWLVSAIGTYRALWIGGIAQLLSNIMFILQAHLGHNIDALIFTITAENLSAGIGSAAFVAFLGNICNVSYTATQYALLSAIAAFARIALAAPSGWLAEQLGWPIFFLASMVAAVPGLLLLRRLKHSHFLQRN